MKKKAVLIGATGLTGKHLLAQLLEHPAYEQVISLTRRPCGIQHPRLKEYLYDFDKPDSSFLQGTDFYCALGTTLARAGSKEAQYKVDCTYPLVMGKLARQNGFTRFLLVSSIGADAHSSNFYLRTKGELEEGLAALGFDTFVAARPSFLLGHRTEFRLGEKIGLTVWKYLQPLLIGPLRRWKGIPAATVAAALIHYANDGTTGLHYPEYDALQRAAQAE